MPPLRARPACTPAGTTGGGSICSLPSQAHLPLPLWRRAAAGRCRRPVAARPQLCARRRRILPKPVKGASNGDGESSRCAGLSDARYHLHCVTAPVGVPMKVYWAIACCQTRSWSCDSMKPSRRTRSWSCDSIEPSRRTRSWSCDSIEPSRTTKPSGRQNVKMCSDYEAADA